MNPTTVPAVPVDDLAPVESPAARSARAEHLHRRLQLEHAYLTRARQEWLNTKAPAPIAQLRAAYILARGARALAAHDAAASAEVVAA